MCICEYAYNYIVYDFMHMYYVSQRKVKKQAFQIEIMVMYKSRSLGPLYRNTRDICFKLFVSITLFAQ